MPNLTTIAKWANSLGISRQQGYAAVKRCEIPVTDGQVDSEYATILYERHTRPRANGKRHAPLAAVPHTPRAGESEGTKTPGYDSSRARREAAEAVISEIKAADALGTYLVKTDVEAIVYKIARALRDGMTNCSRRIGADVAAISDADECEAIITREHRALLASMQHTLAAELGLAAEGGAE